MKKPLSLDFIRQVLAEYFADKPVQRVEIFGSYARGEATAESDVDLLLTMTGYAGWSFLNYADELSERLGTKADVGTGVSEYMMRYIKKDLITLYEPEPKAVA